ncbi:MAG: hypothetical protein KatS3mg087_0153 [Patescibacteria group bacterium]|nr:MAG: hypothetical protein KatS3mg087_0153 [Patescibacteria group bacterium]
MKIRVLNSGFRYLPNNVVLLENNYSSSFCIPDIVGCFGDYVYAYRFNLGVLRWHCLTGDLDFIPTPFVLQHSRSTHYDLYYSVKYNLSFNMLPDLVSKNKLIVLISGPMELWFKHDSWNAYCELWTVYDFDAHDAYGCFLRFLLYKRALNSGSVLIRPANSSMTEADFMEVCSYYESDFAVDHDYFNDVGYGVRGNSLILGYRCEFSGGFSDFSDFYTFTFNLKKGGDLKLVAERMDRDDAWTSFYIREDFGVKILHFHYFSFDDKLYRLNAPRFVSGRDLFLGYVGFAEPDDVFIVRVFDSDLPRSESPLLFAVSLEDFRKYKEDVLHHSMIVNKTLPEWVGESSEIYERWRPGFYVPASQCVVEGVFDDLFMLLPRRKRKYGKISH